MQLQGLDWTDFLNNDWQSRPRFLAGALSAEALAGVELPDANTLAGLAMDEDVESRLVEISRGRHQLRHGPFSESELTGLPASDWTLLVQHVDFWLPELRALLAAFAPLPRWRFDDIMASCAATGGGVGPHLDQYDVFLIQTSGERDWRIGAARPPAGETPSPVDGGEGPLRLLDGFDTVATYRAKPGDILYLPPGVPHDGVAGNDDCVTLSIGFRAPSSAELMLKAADIAAAGLGDSDRFRDAGNRSEGSRIRSVDAVQLQAFVPGIHAQLTAALLPALGCLVTETAVIDEAEVDTGAWNAGCRLAWFADDQQCWLFANGDYLAVPVESAGSLKSLCDSADAGSAPPEDLPESWRQWLVDVAALSA